MRWKTVLVLATLGLHMGKVFAYELGTHARLTNAAFQRSALADGSFMRELGIDANDPAPFGETYFDVAGTAAQQRARHGFEARYMPNGARPLSIAGWLMRGAIREDDVPWPFGSNPQDDPYNQLGFFRVFNHFYDPVHNRPLTAGIGWGEIAPQWAIGSSDVFSNLNAPNASRRNHFTVLDAREAMYRALTGKTSGGAKVEAVPGTVLTNPADIRKAYWATTFRALGDVVHLLQDMAQPQHTRNDAHSGNRYDGEPGVRGHKSVYEAYIEERATGGIFSTAGRVFTGPISVRAERVDYGTYTIPSFNNYLDFYTTRHKDAGVLASKGMADYSNRGFFTSGTNLGRNAYGFPSNNPNDGSYVLETISVDWRGVPIPAAGSVLALRRDVPDSVTPAARAPARVTSYGLWDQFLNHRGFDARYTLNRYNYDDMANLLIPRAVAYSAGMINYFFRGKIDWVADPNNPGQYLLKNLGPEQTQGDFVLYYDAEDGRRYPATGGTWTQASIQPGGQQTVSLRRPGANDPEPKNPGEYMLVFRGAMGQELPANGTVGAVAGKLVYDPLVVQVQRYSLTIGRGGLGPDLYGVDTVNAKNPMLADAIDRFGGNMTLTLNGESIPCVRWAPGSLDCRKQDLPGSGLTIDAMGATAWDGKPWFYLYHLLAPAASVTLNHGNTVLFSFDVASVGLVDLGVLSFSNTFHLNARNALIGLW